MTIEQQQQTPPTPAEAATQLAQLKNDAGWVKSFLAGDGPKVAEHRRLTEISVQDAGGAIDRAMAGVVPNSSAGLRDASAQVMAETAAHLRGVGIPDEAIKQHLSGTAVTQEEFDTAQRTKDRLMRDQDFTKLYLGGNGPQREQMGLLNIILTSPIKEKA